MSERMMAHQPADLFGPMSADPLGLDGFAESKWRKLAEDIRSARKTGFARFIEDLRIPKVGTKRARMLAAKFRDFAALRKATAERLEQVKGIRSVISGKITGYFRDVTEDARSDAERLRTRINRHDHLYYVENRPEISDGAYDMRYRELQAIEEVFPELVTPDSPTQRVGADPLSELPVVPHVAPMLSLDSSEAPGDVRRFDERVRKAVDGPVEYMVEPKLDGSSLEVVYEDGVLVRAVTRGNGVEGEGVTENARTIRSVPLRLTRPGANGSAKIRPSPPSLLAVRGEVLMYLSSFNELNRKRAEDGLEAYANPRNAAAGALRQLDSREAHKRPLEFFAYDILAPERGTAFDTDEEAVEALRAWGLRPPPHTHKVADIKKAIAYHEELAKYRDGGLTSENGLDLNGGFEFKNGRGESRLGVNSGHSNLSPLDYEIDGVVIKLNALAPRAKLGSTSHHPRWAFAFKFPPRKEVTRLEDIAVQVGRTGKLTPVAILRPVEVGGVTVSRASLHNREELERKDVRVGDLVRVQRAGDVIPQVVEWVEEAGRERSEPFRMPAECPRCGAAVAEEGPFVVCANRLGCPAQLERAIEHFVSRGALDIEGLGSETVALLVDKGLVRQPADLFDLKADVLLGLDGFAETRARKLVEAIRSAKKTELARFIHGLGIPEVGATVARALATEFRDLAVLREATAERLEQLEGIGPIMSGKITAFFRDDARNASLDAILSKGFELAPPPKTESERLEGKSFVFTGRLVSISRPEARKLVEGAGGRVVSSLSSATSYLVKGKKPGSKAAKAEKLEGVKVLDEEGFLKLLDTGMDDAAKASATADDTDAPGLADGTDSSAMTDEADGVRKATDEADASAAPNETDAPGKAAAEDASSTADDADTRGVADEVDGREMAHEVDVSTMPDETEASGVADESNGVAGK